MVSPSTLSKDLKLWRSTFKFRGKSIYYGRHERSDVVKYRKKWTREILEYKKQMDTFGEAGVTEADIEEGGKKIVMVIHSECIFYSNDGSKTLCILKGKKKSLLHHKVSEASIMVSEFQCPCHGTMMSVSDPETLEKLLTAV
ncbi:hypothetical protein G6F56_011038 [Rhizopus delemar]|nr:hypothetical protein G6F56_011038 [Rhizopus delemar]